MDDHIRKDPVFLKEDSYLAHVVMESGATQNMVSHLGGTDYLAEKNCPLEIMRNILKVTALLHDAGEFSEEYFDYMQEVLKYREKVRRRQIDHSSAGGRMIEEMEGNCILSDLVSAAVYSHHGLQDCIDMESGETLSGKRKKREIDFQAVKKRYFEVIDKVVLKEYMEAAHADVQKISSGIDKFLEKRRKSRCGGEWFYWGMYERLLLSLLIDSDWTETACFVSGEPYPERLPEEGIRKIWEESVLNYEKYMEELKRSRGKSPLDIYRDEISRCCVRAAESERKLYRLTAPTGAGKTLSSLGFALNHARKYHKRHIFYVAPYNSILEKNADVIRKAVGNEAYVLEHHCNVSFENEQEELKYCKLTENWDSPVVVTTAVQMLNTLFSDQKSSIRRMYNLCNSVIIFDEVQAFPVKGTELFNMAVNFLTVFCNTTVVLCSATQPSLATLKENNLYDCIEMTGNAGHYAEVFKRVEIEDRTNMVPGGMRVEELRDFAYEAFRKYRHVLIIVNTRSCAKKVYEALKERCEEKCRIYHLSGNMCPQNRSEEIDSVKKDLESENPVICVSTQIVEAGVDLSFGCVIRSLAGLDSILQAAGRCNRHKELTRGMVYIIRTAQEAECLKGLEEIRSARSAAEKILDYFRAAPENFSGTLDLEVLVSEYYKVYFSDPSGRRTKYRSSIQEITLEELLGKNEPGQKQYERKYGRKREGFCLNQAFKTAGQDYKAIPEGEVITIVIPYDKTAEEAISVLMKPGISLSEQKRALRKLQRYSVGIPERKKEELGNAVYRIKASGVFVLSPDHYDKKVGVLETPGNGFLNF